MEDDTGQQRALKRKIHEIVGEFILKHLWKIVIGTVAFFSGGGLTYLSVWSQVSDAVKAAHEAKMAADQLEKAVQNLATRDQLNDAKERIQRLEDRLDYAKEQAGTPPIPQRRRSR